MAGSSFVIGPALQGRVDPEDPDDQRSTHYGLHLDGRIRAYARRLPVPAADAKDPAIRALATGLPHCVDHVCMYPGQDEAGLLFGALLRFVLAAIWADAPGSSIFLNLPAVGVPYDDLCLLGAQSGPDPGKAPASGLAQWLVPPVDASLSMPDLIEIKNTLDRYGEEWRRSGTIHVLAGERAGRWA